MPTEKMPSYVLYSSQGNVLVESTWAAAQVHLKSQYLVAKRPSKAEARRTAEDLQEFLRRSHGLPPCYTDGAYRDGIAIGAAFFAPGDPRNAVSLLSAKPATSQRAELWGAILALRAAGERPVCVVTDSAYVFRAMAECVPSWERNNDLLEILRDLRKDNGCLWTKGHQAGTGNQAAHELAQTLFAPRLLRHDAPVCDNSLAPSLGELHDVSNKGSCQETRGVLQESSGQALDLDA